MDDEVTLLLRAKKGYERQKTKKSRKNADRKRIEKACRRPMSTSSIVSYYG